MNDERYTVQIIFDERMLRAVNSSVEYTLKKWTGEGNIDQETLFEIRPILQGAILEFEFARDMG